jgi:hypothetical protein
LHQKATKSARHFSEISLPPLIDSRYFSGS